MLVNYAQKIAILVIISCINWVLCFYVQNLENIYSFIAETLITIVVSGGVLYLINNKIIKLYK